MPRALILALIAAFVLVEPAYAADPSLTMGKILVVGAFSTAGIALAAFGVFLLVRAQMNANTALALPQWPTVEGKVLSSGVDTRSRQMTPVNRLSYYVPQLRYAYTIGGTNFEGSVIRPGLDMEGHAVEADARAHIARYPVGGTVTVHYNPQDPKDAALEGGIAGGARWAVVGIGFTLVGIFLLGFMFWFAQQPLPT